MARQISATEAKAKLLALLDEVEAGEEAEITRRGVIIARLAPRPRGPQGQVPRCRHQHRQRRGALRRRGDLGRVVTAVLLDTHVLHWWSSEPEA